jgi:putative OPT family oligopeptide transporter
VIGAVAKVGVTGLKLWAEVVQFAGWIVKPTTAAAGATGAKAGTPFYFGINASPALLAVGYIVGFNVALVIFSGAIVNRWIAIPLYTMFADASTKVGGVPLAELLDGANPLKAADTIHGAVTRYLGVGGMLVGGVWSLYKLRKSLLGGIQAGLQAYRNRKAGGGAVARTEHDMPMNIILILIAASVIPLFFLFNHFVHSIAVSAVMSVVVIVAGFLFSAVASYMAGLVGSSNNPVSGITISTILVAATLLLAMGLDNKAGPIAAILIGGVVCCAAAIGGDNLQDLKCGQLVGSTPWKQQTMQIIGVVVAAVAMAPILDTLNNAYHIGSKGLSAPQAQLMGTVAKGVFAGGLPWTINGVGAAVAAGIIVLDSVLEARKASFRVPVMAFAVGVYLPYHLSTPIFFGGAVAWLVAKKLNKEKASAGRREEVERMGLLAAAGFITGEALMGIGLAVPIGIKHDENALALGLTTEGCKADPTTGIVPACKAAYADFWLPSLAFVAIVLILLYILALRPEAKGKKAAAGTPNPPAE